MLSIHVRHDCLIASITARFLGSQVSARHAEYTTSHSKCQFHNSIKTVSKQVHVFWNTSSLNQSRTRGLLAYEALFSFYQCYIIDRIALERFSTSLERSTKGKISRIAEPWYYKLLPVAHKSHKTPKTSHDISYHMTSSSILQHHINSHYTP